MRQLFLLLLLGLVACGGAPATALTAADVVSAFTAAGVPVENVQPGVRPADSPLPNSFKEYVTFTIPSLGDKGGQVFVCETKQNCDALYAYFDALKGIGGPYYYQSPSGTVVAQLNSGLAADEAAKFEQAVAGLK
jgi:hypothetical protein